MNLPLIQEYANGHQPDIHLIPSKLCYTVIKKSGKQLLIAYPTCTFFDSGSSDSMYLFVSLNIASVMASLYPARSKGYVKSSTSSSVSSGFFSWFIRLSIRIPWLANKVINHTISSRAISKFSDFISLPPWLIQDFDIMI